MDAMNVDDGSNLVENLKLLGQVSELWREWGWGRGPVHKARMQRTAIAASFTHVSADLLFCIEIKESRCKQRNKIAPLLILL